MPAAVSTSLTTGDTRAYIYPERAEYAAETKPVNVLYRMMLFPKPPETPKPPKSESS
jgi:hypothetical protein